MDKEFIIGEIRRTASDNDGEPLGRNRFEKVTGIKVTEWLGIHWARWGDALEEAGYQANSLQGAIGFEVIADSMIEMIRHYHKFPSSAEIKLYRKEKPEIPSEGTFRKFGGKVVLATKMVEYCSSHTGVEDVLQICKPIAEEKPRDAELADVPTSEETGYGHVYLMKSGKYYKIGRSNSAARREYELSIQLPERIETLHVISTDDPPGIEAYWHKRFEGKRLNGEWFDLDPADIRAFKRRTFM